MFASATLDRADIDLIENDDEHSLIARLKARDESAYEALVRTHAPRMLSVANRLLKTRDDAEDAVQQSFLSAFSALERFELRSCMATWLHRIVVNICLMQLRHRQRHPAALFEDLLPHFNSDGCHMQPVSDWTETAFERISRDETRSQVRACLDKLPEHYRTVIQLRDIEEFDTATTAEMLGVSEAVVKTRLHRARTALRELLGEVFNESAGE